MTASFVRWNVIQIVSSPLLAPIMAHLLSPKMARGEYEFGMRKVTMWSINLRMQSTGWCSYVSLLMMYVSLPIMGADPFMCGMHWQTVFFLHKSLSFSKLHCIPTFNRCEIYQTCLCIKRWTNSYIVSWSWLMGNSLESAGWWQSVILGSIRSAI